MLLNQRGRLRTHLGSVNEKRETKTRMIFHGDCLDVLKKLEADSLDSLVTDPPAGISFMGKEWDSNKGGSKEWIAWMTEVMRECLRVLKPGAHGLVWAIPRTSHWTATACEEAGFEIRDVITHIFGSGFPKSLDISKSIDKAAGAERAILEKKSTYRKPQAPNGWDCSKRAEFETAPATPEANQWQGFGTALKPASEHWILIRKPISEKTVAANVLKHGTGGINIDASRIGTETITQHKRDFSNIHGNKYGPGVKQPVLGQTSTTTGRFPANLVFSHNEHCDSECTPGCAVAMLDEQSKDTRAGKPSGSGRELKRIQTYEIGEVSGASRFFYCAKASKRERNEGCEGEVKEKQGARPNSKDMSGKFPDHDHRPTGGNNHPTVKPIKLMQYLITMITPPNGVVLDPFCGSGSTGVAAIQAGFQFIGIEREKEYIQIAEKRIFHKFPEFKKELQGRG